MKNLLNGKKIVIAGVVIVILLVGGVMLLGGKSSQKPGQTETSIKNEAAIPTVDSSVKVTLEPLPSGKEVFLTVKGIPSGTKNLEYELSYDARNAGPRGVLTQIDVSGQDSYEKKITLGTCSSGTCIYDDVVSDFRLSLKFTGGYGQRIFEKDFPRK